LRQTLEISGPIPYHRGFRIQGKPVSFLGQAKAWRALHRVGLAISFTGAMVVPLALAGAGQAWGKGPAVQDVGSVAWAELPPEAQTTDRLIRAGGPFPYPKDGMVFGNRERLLPAKPRGFWREYTVKTPGARNRGARRIVCGGHEPVRPETCFYTGDHYASFQRIVY
jgi:ribonuclease T1